MKAQTPVMRVPFTNALLLKDNGLTNNKQNTLEPLIIHNNYVNILWWVAKTYSKIDKYQIMKINPNNVCMSMI